MQNEQTKSFKELLQEELEDRIEEIESPDCVVIIIVGIV